MSDTPTFRFTHRQRVRWADVDPQGIVFNPNYLVFLDTAITEYWRAVGLPYPEGVSRFGGDIFMRKSTVEYHDSARFDDVIEVSIRCERIGRSSLTFVWSIHQQERHCVDGEAIYVYADPVAKVSAPVPDALREMLTTFEAGKPMFTVRTGNWSELATDARTVRTAVFINEQRIPEDMEWDEADASAVHAVAYNALGEPLGTGRLLEHVPGVAKIGRMAVARGLRGSGVGRQLLDALMQSARDRGDREAVLHAQVAASGFYSQAGFIARGPQFDEVGIPHIEMVRAL